MATATETKRFLPFLSPVEESRILAEASLRTFDADEVVLEQNVAVRAIYLIELGSVRIEREAQGEKLRLAGLGRGEFFGEMSFVQPGPTSASVVAEALTQLRVIDEAAVESMGRADPSFAGRFFRSIAVIISERLRLTSLQVDTLITGIDRFSGVRRSIEAAASRLPGPDWRLEPSRR